MIGGWTTWLRVAVLGLLASVAFAGWSVLRALEVDPIPAVAPMPEGGDIERGSRRTRARANIAAAVNVDPFNPARRRPDEPYRFPGEIVTASSAGPQRTTQLRLIGTVASVGGGGFVVCRIGSQQPQIVHVGQQIGAYTLKSVQPGHAVFTGPSGETVELTISQPTQQGR